MDDPHELITVDPVAIPEEKARGGIPGKRLPDLLAGPRGGGMLGDIDVEYPSPVMSEDDEDEEDEP